MGTTFPRAVSFRVLNEEAGTVPQCPPQNTHGKKTLGFLVTQAIMNDTMF